MLPPGAIERLFEHLRGRKTQSVRGDRTPLRLGLLIVRMIARAHGGDVHGTTEEQVVRFGVELSKHEALA